MMLIIYDHIIPELDIMCSCEVYCNEFNLLLAMRNCNSTSIFVNSLQMAIKANDGLTTLSYIGEDRLN